MEQLKHNRRAAQGYTLVELLVGLFLGLFIVGVALTYMVSTIASLRLQTSESLAQENARYALEILGQHIRLAGLNSQNNADQILNKIVLNDNVCANDENGLADGTRGSTACTKDGADNAIDNNSDRVAIDYVVDRRNEQEGVILVGCNGTETQVPVGTVIRFANVFWTADLDGDEIRSLYCQTIALSASSASGAAVPDGAIGTPQPIVDGIERIQIQYGLDYTGKTELQSDGSVLDLDQPDGVVEAYLPISSYNKLTCNTQSYIRSMRIAMLVSGGVNVGNEAATEDKEARSYVLLDADPVAFGEDDRVFRQVFSTTVRIPNKGSQHQDQC